jgi:hypothetical protein
MSRVEPKDRPVKREAQPGRRQPPPDRTHSKAEGEEAAVEEALRRQK